MKIYKVFISSTFKDLQEERKGVIDALLSINCMPIAMEFFPGSEREPIDLITQTMDECDYYLLVVKGKYGSIHVEKGVSFSELEYDYAIGKNIPTLIFLYSEPQNLRVIETENDYALKKKLEEFLQKIVRHTVYGWTNPENLARGIAISMDYLVKHNPREGYSRLDTAAKDQNYLNAGIKTFDRIEKQEKKIGYIKFMHLSKMNEPGIKPIYQRYLPRLDKTIPVYDEYVLFRLNEFSEEITGLVSKDSSTGVVDLSIINPWQARLLIPEGVYEQSLGELEETIYNPSKVFFTCTHYYNAFQDNQRLSIKMVKDTAKARLIVDFRYIANSREVVNFKHIKAFLISGHNAVKLKLTVHNKFPEYGKKYAQIDSLFWINADNLKKGDVLQLEFKEAINWNSLKVTENI